MENRVTGYCGKNPLRQPLGDKSVNHVEIRYDFQPILSYHHVVYSSGIACG